MVRFRRSDAPPQVPSGPSCTEPLGTSPNVEAAEKGPTAYRKRVVRRKVYRKSNTVVGQVMRVSSSKDA